MWQYGYVAMWLHGHVAMRLYAYAATLIFVRIPQSVDGHQCRGPICPDVRFSNTPKYEKTQLMSKRIPTTWISGLFRLALFPFVRFLDLDMFGFQELANPQIENDK